VARPANAVADGPAVDEAGRLERPELLEDTRSACAKDGCELLRRARTVASKLDEDLAP
jgi:hypothetical protein